MKILEIIPQLGQGGAERFVVDLSNELSKSDDVTLVVLHSIDRTGFFAKEISPKVKLISMNKRMGMDFRLFFRLHKLIRKESPNVVHTHLRAIVYCLLTYLPKPKKIKFIHTVHNDAEKEAGSGISKWCRKFAFLSKRVTPVTISEESRRSFIDFYGITPPMIYNGRPPYKESPLLAKAKDELGKLRADSDSAMIVNIARISPQKKQLSLARAIDSLNKKGRNVELAIIGRNDDSPITPQLQALNCKQLHLLGTRTNPRDYMKTADAFCLSSVYEGMPITLIECFSVGAIPICTPVGGIINMIDDGKNGILATGTSQEEIEAAILRFLNLTDEERAEMRRNSLASFAKYDMATCAINYKNLMKKLS